MEPIRDRQKPDLPVYAGPGAQEQSQTERTTVTEDLGAHLQTGTTTMARDLSVPSSGRSRPPDGRKRAMFKYTIPPDAQLAPCKGPNCGKDVWWFKYKNKRGGLSTVCADADGTPHHATCPDVGIFRKRREAS